MDERPRVCYLLQSTDLWGGVKVVFQQAEQLAARGFDVTVLSLDDGPDWYDLGVPHRRVPDFGGRHLPSADAYVGTFFTTVPAAHDSGLGIGVHLVQGYEAAGRPAGPVRDRIDFVYSLTTVKVAVSPHLARLVRERFGQPCRTLRNGIDLGTFHPEDRPAPAARPRIAVTGAFEVASKRVPQALAALAQLRSEGIEFDLVRIAQTPLPPQERALLAATEEHVHVGADAVADVLRSCDLFVSLLGDEEGFGLPAMEAMACGCAAVLSDVPCHRGFAEAIGASRDHARFVSTPQEATAAVRELLRDPAERAVVATRGSALARRYGWDEVGDELAETMRELIAAEEERWRVRNERLVPGESDALTEALHQQRYAHARTFAGGRRVLDAGCGVGYGARAMADSGAVDVLAVDQSSSALAYAARRFDHPAIEWREGDLLASSWPDGSRDLITFFEVFEHVDAPGPLVASLAAALSEDGVALISTPNGAHPSNAGHDEPAYVHHVREYDLEEFWALLGAYFGHVEVLGQGVQGGQLVLAPAHTARDLTFVGVCRAPLPAPAPGASLTLLGAPDLQSDTGWRALLRVWAQAFASGDPVTLELLTDQPAFAEASLVAALAELGLDPETLPDTALVAVDDLLGAAAVRLAAGAAFVPLGVEDARLGRVAAACGAEVLVAPTVQDLRARVAAPAGAAA